MSNEQMDTIQQGKANQKPTFLDVGRAFDIAGHLLGQRDPDSWAAWACYLLELLDDHASPETFNTVLQDLREDLAMRQEEGCW